jgi:hypothetical protein
MQILPTYLQQQLDALKKRASALEQRADNEDEQKRREYLFEAVGAMFEKANIYMALLHGVGYVGYFSVWQSASEFMSRSQKLWSLTLIGGSLILFISWQVTLNLILARQQSGIAKVALTPSEGFGEAAAKHAREGQKLSARMARLLLPINVLILGPGVAGLAIVLWVLGCKLISEA